MNKTLHFAIALGIMALTTYLIRLLPLLLLRRPVKSRFLRSFFYYVPYAVLSAMTFPTVIYATGNPLTGAAATVVCIILALLRLPLPAVAAGGALSVALCELFLSLIIL